jgi:hypothetical protein
MELIRRLHASQEKKFLEAAEAERKAQANSILTKISPASVEADQEKGAKIWQKAPFFGNWLLDNAYMRAWLDAGINVLWLRGNLGAGKLT